MHEKRTANNGALLTLLDVITNRQIIVKLLTLICLKIYKDERVG